ncbi:alpha-amylase family glycosyl hydrolase [Herbiconiux sp.]|uniref:alpha-amylase family glycosyl hydrolase n=1 Tax=Herbiconiux sp. TaxID=1871186 RepID=UPI0025C40787|nr:alpha-amylase family glycosyl hydrolase [Herbiconiux sp.]
MYEVYPRSFADADGDGVGDLRGIIERMPYLASLGVDGLWLTPFQRSPQVDQGYDISDYCDVDPLFGTLADFDELLASAHENGLRILVDIVPNHTSTDNPLYEAALAAGPGSPERDMFVFRPGRGADQSEPPNNWISVFGGPAWHRAAPDSATDTEWYLHLFSPGQPDWNWENPAVAAYFERVIRFWFDRGVDGIRVDVAHGLFKAEGLPDSPTVPTVIDGLRSNPLAMDQDAVHEVYRHWRRVADSYSPGRLLVGEVNLEPIRSARYTRPDELHQTFAFAFAKLDWDAATWVSVGGHLEEVRQSTGSAPSWALENHDIVRTATRFGGGALGRRRARAALVALLGLPGAVYVYQGQELGLPEVDVPVAERADPMWQHGGVSRDGARIPLPWVSSATGTHGFSPSGAGRPWLPVPEGWGRYSIQVQEETPGSDLRLFREATALRAALAADGAFGSGDGVRWGVDGDSRLIAERGRGVRIVVAMGEAAVPLPPGEVLLSSEPLVDGMLPASAAAWVR